MNATTPATHRALRLVEIIDFKWLMAGAGHRVHVEQLQADPGYARKCLVTAAGSAVPALRDTADRLARTLGIDPASLTRPPAA